MNWQWKILIKQALQVVRSIGSQFDRNKGLLNAAALTYTTLFAVVPMMTVTYAMLASIPSFGGVGEQIENLIFQNFIPSTGDTVKQYLTQFAAQAKNLTAVGVVFLMVTSLMMLKSIENALNTIWNVHQPRRGISSFLLYWAVLSLGPLLLGAGFAVSSFLASLPLITDATDVLGGKEFFLGLLPATLSAGAFTLIYAAVPNCPVPLKNAFFGGVIVAALFECAKLGFTFYVTQFPSYQLIYGAFAAFPLFLAWIYLSWVIILLGAELVRALTLQSNDEESETTPDLLLGLRVLNKLWEAQKSGETVSERRLLKSVPGLNRQRWELLSECLIEAQIIGRSDRGGVLLSRDLNYLTLWDLWSVIPANESRWSSVPLQQRGWERQTRDRVQEIYSHKKQQMNISVANLLTHSEKEAPVDEQQARES